MREGLRLSAPVSDQSMRFLRFKELRTIIPLGRTTIWKMIREGTFPKSHRIGKNATAWVESEILEWMTERANGNTPSEGTRKR